MPSLGWLVLEEELCQGEILYSFLFNIYANSLTSVLRSSDLGRHIGSTCIGCFAYADGSIILSASVVKLPDMLKLCFVHAEDLRI